MDLTGNYIKKKSLLYHIKKSNLVFKAVFSFLTIIFCQGIKEQSQIGLFFVKESQSNHKLDYFFVKESQSNHKLDFYLFSSASG